MSKKKFKDTGVGKFLLNKIPNVVGAIAGDTPVGSVIQAIIGGSDMSDEDKAIALKKLDLEEHVTIHNKFVAESEIKKWFSIADFVIQTNLNATQSGIISIAIYFEKIIITTAQGGIKEILNNDNSFICEKNSKSISDNILNAIDSDLKEKTKQLKILKKKLNWDSFSKQLLDFIK